MSTMHIPQLLKYIHVFTFFSFYIILPSYLFGQPCLFGQYGNDVIGEPAHVLIPSLQLHTSVS